VGPGAEGGAVPFRGGLRQAAFGERGGIERPSETIHGTITWDKASEDGLPKIVTAEGKEYRWAELGKELMIREGWRVKIELG